MTKDITINSICIAILAAKTEPIDRKLVNPPMTCDGK